jgi:hypothetical protein
MADKIKGLGAIAKLAMSGALLGLGENLFVTKKAIELIYTGYEDPILSLLTENPLFKDLAAGMPDRIGFFYGVSCK